MYTYVYISMVVAIVELAVEIVIMEFDEGEDIMMGLGLRLG